MNALKIRQTLSRATVSACFILSAAVISAADYNSAAFQNAYENYVQVSEQDSGSSKKLAARWLKLHEQDQNDPLALVLLGASHTLMGRDAMMPWTKMSHTEKGLDEMAMAQRLLTDAHKQQQFQGTSVELQVNITAAIIFTQVPEFFGRHEDGFYLFSDILANPSFQAQPSAAQTYVYYYAINAANLIGKTAELTTWKQQLNELNQSDEFTVAAQKIGAES